MPLGLGGTSELKILLSLKDKASAKLKTFNKDFKSMATGIAKGAAIAGAAMAVGIGVKAVKAAVEFEKSMANVATLVDTNVESMDKMGKEVSKIAKRTPVEISSLTTALYNVRSAGISASDAMEVLEISARLGVAGLATTEEATNLLTTAFNNFSDQGYEADEIANILFKTVKAGKTTVAELAQAFGNVAPIAKAAGVSLEEMQAATAALTVVTGKTAESQNRLRALFDEMTRTEGKLASQTKALGIENVETLISTNGLEGAMRILYEATGKNDIAFKNLFGSVEAGGAALLLLGGANEVYNATLDSTLDKTDLLTEAFEKKKATVEAMWQIFHNKLDVELKDLGMKIIPILLTAVENAIKVFRSFFKVTDTIWTTFVKLKGAVTNFGLEIDLVAKKLAKFLEQASNKSANFFVRVGEAFDPFGGLNFDKGGIVPGAIGSPVPAIVHGGETIIPPGKSAGGITINITGNTFMATEEGAEAIGDMIIEKLKTQMRFQT